MPKKKAMKTDEVAKELVKAVSEPTFVDTVPEPPIRVEEPIMEPVLKSEPLLTERVEAGPELVEKVLETVKQEPLLTVTVSEDFKDGALSARFAKYGYETLWKKGETRQIPMNLFVRCKRSGAKFEL